MDTEADKVTFDYEEIEVGDYVDFGPYGKLYVCDVRPGEQEFWVTDDKFERDNPDAPGWYIRKSLAERIIEKYQ